MMKKQWKRSSINEVIDHQAGKPNTEPLADSSNETRSEFYYPKSPQINWDFSHTTSLKIIDAITTIACPFTILFNRLGNGRIFFLFFFLLWRVFFLSSSPKKLLSAFHL